MSDGASAHCYRIVHRTQYRYSDIVTSSYGRGFPTPRELARQRCLRHELRIDPEPVDRSVGVDVYGNVRTFFHVTSPHRTLTVHSESIVEVNPAVPQCYPPAADAPWESARPAGSDAAVEFLTCSRPKSPTR